MSIERMSITKEVVTRARERLGYSRNALAQKRPEFKKLAEWESGESKPTYRQLELLAKELWVPVAIFFFPEPPQFPDVEETFRTMGSEQFAEVPPRIRLLLRKARAFQIGLAELNDGKNPAGRILTRELTFSVDNSINSMAAQLREAIGVTHSDQFDWHDDATALKSWRKAFYDVGVTVFKDAFQEDHYCGFSLYDEEFPIIYVNNSNAKTRQIFTLFHELAHLLFNTSGIDSEHSFRSKLSEDQRRIETTCNALAAATLVPDEVLNRELVRGDDRKLLAEDLARKFSVSEEVIFRRFLDRGQVSREEYALAKQEWDTQYIEYSKKGGGNFYRTKIAYLGEEYVSLAFKRYYQNRIDVEELADYLAIKPKQVELLEDILLGAQS